MGMFARHQWMKEGGKVRLFKGHGGIAGGSCSPNLRMGLPNQESRTGGLDCLYLSNHHGHCDLATKVQLPRFTANAYPSRSTLYQNGPGFRILSSLAHLRQAIGSDGSFIVVSSQGATWLYVAQGGNARISAETMYSVLCPFHHLES